MWMGFHIQQMFKRYVQEQSKNKYNNKDAETYIKRVADSPKERQKSNQLWFARVWAKFWVFLLQDVDDVPEVLLEDLTPSLHHLRFLFADKFILPFLMI